MNQAASPSAPSAPDLLPLWHPGSARIAASQMTGFRTFVNQRHGLALETEGALYDWSITATADFWNAVWDFTGVIATERGTVVVDDPLRLPGARWYPEAKLNYAENLLRQTGDAPALIFQGEDKLQRTLSWDELHALVSRLQQALQAAGIQAGDRVAAYLPNMPESIAAFLACASIGAIWSSASPDFGVQGVLDRFGQIEPRLLLASDGYGYGGKWQNTLERLPAILGGLPSVEQTIILPYDGQGAGLAALPSGQVSLMAFLAPFAAQAVRFLPLPFDHPLYILFSSGTTGIPKCIVHRAGGALLQHLKEHRLHCDLRPGERVFYFTTLGWMMWNWLVGALACGCTLILYDGNPAWPKPDTLWDLAENKNINLFGTSARWLDASAKTDVEPMKTHNLSHLRLITSTGSVLAPEGFDYVYGSIKGDVQLASISGGTDIVSCFILGNPNLPVWRGQIQCRGLGMAVQVFDESGHPVRGQKGELVCTRAFPSMPVFFWNDADGRKYHKAYFDRFPGVWCHGDWVELTDRDGIIVFGRSDATLNPGGVRIGTAEIYRPVERMAEIAEALVVGQQWQGDERVVLFVRLQAGQTLDDALQARIRARIRAEASPRHVPAIILSVPEIPRTKSGKIVELAVRETIHGRPVKNIEALANPDALAYFANRAELAQ